VSICPGLAVWGGEPLGQLAAGLGGRWAGCLWSGGGVAAPVLVRAPGGRRAAIG
jgi:hypothetical protein